MTPEARTKKARTATTRTKRSGEASVTRKPAKSPVTRKATKPATSGQYRSPRSSAGSSTEVAQVRLRPDEMAGLRLVMQSLNLPSVSDALREGLRLLSREAAEVAASEEIRAFYQGAPAPAPAGVLPATAEELAAGDDIEW